MKWTIKSNVCLCAFWWPQCSKIDCTIFEFQTIKLQTHTQHHQREKWLKHKSIQSYTAYAFMNLINRVKQIHSHHIHLLILKKIDCFFSFIFSFFLFLQRLLFPMFYIIIFFFHLMFMFLFLVAVHFPDFYFLFIYYRQFLFYCISKVL